MFRVHPYLLLVFLLFFSCKKDKDKTQPFIQIDTPLRNSVVMAGQSIHITGSVSDDQRLEYVTVKILSIDGNTQLAEPVDLDITGKDMAIDRTMTVGDIHTTYGTYQVVVEASDGKNKNKVYTEIVVNEIPRVFRKLVVVRKSGAGYAVDSLAGSTFQTFITRPEDVSSTAISNYHQLLYVAGHLQGSVMAYNLSTKQVAWNHAADISATGNPLFFTNVYDVTGKVLWQSMAGSTMNTLKSITVTGSVQKNIQMQAAHYAGAILMTDDNLVVGEQPQTVSGNPMLSYYYTSGFGLAFTTVMPFEAVKIFSLNSHQLVIFGNNGNQGEMRVYDKNTNGFWEQVNIPTGKIYDAVQINTNDYVVAHQGGLIRFEQDVSNMITIGPGHQVQVLQLDQYSGTLYGGEGYALKIFDPLTGSELTSFTATDSVKAILLHYNK